MEIRTSRSGEDAAVRLNDSQKVVISVEFEVGDVRRWASVNDKF